MLAETFTKSRRSMTNGTCLEARWKTSARCTSATDCVEGRQDDGVVQIRDSKDPAGPVLTFEPAAWQAFIDAVKADELPLTG